MINIKRALANKRLMLALTGVTPQEFLSLIPSFSQSYLEEKRKQHRRNAKEREFGGGRIGFLKTAPEKLFFILFYYKCYPTYDLISLIFSCNRSNACRRQFQLSKVLEKTLGKKMALPVRKMKTPEEFFAAFPGAREVFIDGTERPVQRSKNKKKQKADYSGKKKRHTRKNVTISTEKKRVNFLSKTKGGKDHDFTILKKEASPDHMPKKVKKHLDLGFKGFDKQFPGHDISMPKRKPRTRDLTEFAKEQNKKKSAVRVLAEHALAGVKRLRIVSDVFRNKKKEFDDTAMLISCGLWNYHLDMK
jgi:hypothetical protein